MSYKYELYLEKHRANVKKGFDWIKENMNSLFQDSDLAIAASNIQFHDASKNDPEEYDAYDAYFYGGNRSYEVVNNFNKAWLRHIHNNPHHWQHWILINDDPKLGEKYIEMPTPYIIEMICDWWSFSWEKGNLLEIFNWYDYHKEYIKFNPTTEKYVEYILEGMKFKLENQMSDINGSETV